MMNLNEWAIKWGISFEAVEDLRREFGIINDNLSYSTDESESAVQTRVRLEASSKGVTLWRNNNGAIHTDDGRFIRYGLANDSQKLNDKFKSSDLIGLKPIHIQQEHVGQVIGQFIAREAKKSGWTYKATKREQAQLKFLQFVASHGGDAAFASEVGTL